MIHSLRVRLLLWLLVPLAAFVGISELRRLPEVRRIPANHAASTARCRTSADVIAGHVAWSGRAHHGAGATVGAVSVRFALW
ncbi:hypothetical protein ACU4GD_15115 [Cupriavidus basilensis]